MSEVNVIQFTAHTLFEILRQYLHAPLFLALHVCVLVYFLQRATPIREETRACLRWVPGQGNSATSSELIRQLELFRTEADRWARRGVLMPMTDISDRLDSMIEGWTDRLHSIANLFMIVGIAGTFFSMIILANASAEEIQTIFRQALGNALPVGFVGLLLTLVFYPMSGWLQSGLERAAAEATRKAIEDRGKREFASAETLLTAFNAVAKLPDTLARSLEPLANLQQTLDATLTRVIQGLDTKWTDTSARLETHVDSMARNVAALSSAAETVGNSLQVMGTTLQKTAAETEELQDIVKQGAQHITLMAQCSNDLHRDVTRSSQALNEAADKLAKFPEVARNEVSNSFKDVAHQCAPSWEKISNDFVNTLSNAATQQIHGISSTADAAGKKLEIAAAKLQEVSATLSGSVVNAVRDGIATLKTPIAEFDSFFRQHYPKLFEQLSETLSDTLNQSDKIRELLVQSDRATGHAQQVEKAWQKLADKVAGTTDALDQVTRSFESVLERLNEIEGHWLAVRLYPTQYKVAAGRK